MAHSCLPASVDLNLCWGSGLKVRYNPQKRKKERDAHGIRPIKTHSRDANCSCLWSPGPAFHTTHTPSHSALSTCPKKALHDWHRTEASQKNWVEGGLLQRWCIGPWDNRLICFYFILFYWHRKRESDNGIFNCVSNYQVVCERKKTCFSKAVICSTKSLKCFSLNAASIHQRPLNMNVFSYLHPLCPLLVGSALLSPVGRWMWTALWLSTQEQSPDRSSCTGPS